MSPLNRPPSAAVLDRAVDVSRLLPAPLAAQQRLGAALLEHVALNPDDAGRLVRESWSIDTFEGSVVSFTIVDPTRADCLGGVMVTVRLCGDS